MRNILLDGTLAVKGRVEHFEAEVKYDQGWFCSLLILPIRNSNVRTGNGTDAEYSPPNGIEVRSKSACRDSVVGSTCAQNETWLTRSLEDDKVQNARYGSEKSLDSDLGVNVR